MTKNSKFNRKQSHSLWNATKDDKGNVMVHRTQAEREDLEDFDFLEAKVANSLGLWGASLTDINDFQNLPQTIRNRFSIVAKEMQQEGEVPPKVMSWDELNSAFEGEKVASVKNKIVYGMKTRQASKVLDVPFIMAADLLEDYEKIGKTAMKDIVDTYKKDAGFGNMVDYGVNKVKDWGNRQVDNLKNTVNEFAEGVQNVPGEIVDNLVPQWMQDAWNYGEEEESVTASKKSADFYDDSDDDFEDDEEVSKKIFTASNSMEELEYILDNYTILDSYKDYSGRGMYGKECVGVIVSRSTSFKIEEEVLSFASYDNMGYDVIFYWKDVKYSDLSGSVKQKFDSFAIEDDDYDDEEPVTASKKSADSDDDLKMAVMNELQSLPPVSDRKLLSIFMARGWDREELKSALPYVISELEGEGSLIRDENENLVLVDGKEAAVRQYGKVASKVFQIMATQCPKVAVDAKAEDYWKAYYGPYGEQLVKEVKKRIKADLAKIWLMKQGVDEAAAKYWQNYFTDENYGEELTKDIPKRLSPKARKRAQEGSGVDLSSLIEEFRSNISDAGLYYDASVAKRELDYNLNSDFDSNQWVALEGTEKDFTPTVSLSNMEAIMKDLSRDYDQFQWMSGGEFAVRVFDENGDLTENGKILEESISSLMVYPALDDEDVSNREYESAIESIGENARGVSEDAPDDWEKEVYSWLWKNNQRVLDTESDGSIWIPSKAISEALSALGYLESEDEEDDEELEE